MIDHPLDPVANIMSFQYTKQIKRNEQWLKDMKRQLIMEVLQRRLADIPDNATIKQWLEDAEFTHRFWAQVYKEARELFENMLSLRNPLGLLSEDIEPGSGALWGNFPQTYSMAGIINAAVRLSKPWEEAL